MKHSKSVAFFGWAVFLVGLLAGLVALQRHGDQTSAQPPAPVKSVAAAPSLHEAAPPPVAPAPVAPLVAGAKRAPAEPAVASSVQTNVAGPGTAPKVTAAKPVLPPSASGGGAALQDPLAREALSLVGLDPGAEAYWMEAINDSRLSAHERQDLIEDLNEEGLSDPKHPAPEDLPVILNRLALIEELAPNAMDEVNSDAFKEAYKDLVNLAELALGGGTPVN